EEKYRSLIDLLYLQGFTQTEAAEALNIPLGTVRTRSKTAIAQLRTLLGSKEWLWPVLVLIAAILWITRRGSDCFGNRELFEIVNIEAYLSSGKLEQYLLGLLSESEAREVEQVAAAYPEIRAELNAMEDALTNYAQGMGIPMPADLPDRIIRRWE